MAAKRAMVDSLSRNLKTVKMKKEIKPVANPKFARVTLLSVVLFIVIGFLGYNKLIESDAAILGCVGACTTGFVSFCGMLIL